jgi:acyl carrier protein
MVERIPQETRAADDANDVQPDSVASFLRDADSLDKVEFAVELEAARVG